MGVDAFCARTSQLADKYGPGFAVTAKVQDAIRSHQPVY
jgi:3-hydroxyacyl-CoA dehydrogenase / enoyl-CoA hydratase / 3-hydroxybutyryl-CoA epimerase